MKKVVLIVIDAMASRVVKPALARGDLPHLDQIANAGLFHEECVSIFPSITPAATASIVTGCYPNRHGIAGAFWYDRRQGKVAYHGDDFWVIVNQGLANFFHEFLIDLNYRRLRSRTLFEHVERAGLQSCVLNYMWFRGDVEQKVNVPLLLELLPGVKFTPHIKGPAICEIADFIRSPHPRTGEPLRASGGLLRRFGFHDETTAEYLLQLGEAGPLPDFTLAYFPNNDFESHSVGAVSALPVLQRVDQHLGEFIESRGGLDRLLDEAVIIVTGDHSQSDVEPAAEDREVDLSEILNDYRLVPGGADWVEENQIMACPNMRAAQIYFSNSTRSAQQSQVVQTLLEHPKIDQIFRATEDESVPGGRRYQVATSDRGNLEFALSRPGETARVHDAYGNDWSTSGELGVVDAETTGDGTIEYGKYPNALERIAAAFNESSGNLMLTARLGAEFCISETESHPGGSHASLHALDSTSPLFAAGLPKNVAVPPQPRIVDVAPLCLDILGKSGVSDMLRHNLMVRRD